MNRYSDTLMQHFLHPVGAGNLPERTGAAIARYPVCGDTIRFFVRVQDGVVADAGFQACGCGLGIACASLAVSLVRGRPLEEAERLTVDRLVDLLILPPAKRHAAELAITALQGALADDRRRRSAEGGDCNAAGK